MADKKAQALERLLTKLSAIRKTLRGEERRLLDSMVLAAQSEVTAHSNKFQPVSKPKARHLPDVELHAASVQSITPVQHIPKPAFRHQVGPKPSTAGQNEGQRIMNITLDGGNYKVSIL